MTDVCDLLYATLLEKLAALKRQSGCSGAILEASFQLCMNHWFQLRDIIHETVFTSSTDEVHFYKNIKPKFTGLIVYYTLLFQAHGIFPLPCDTEEQRMYWTWGLKKIDRFIAQHKSLYDDFKGHSLHLPYCLVTNSKNAMLHAFTSDPATTTTVDHIFANFVGFELYRAHILEQISPRGTVINGEIEWDE